MNDKRGWLTGLLMLAAFTAGAQDYQLFSPDRKTVVHVSVKDSIRYSVKHNGHTILHPAAIGLKTSVSGGTLKVAGTRESSANVLLYPVVRQKNAMIRDHYAQLEIRFRNKLALQWRAYDNGVAWRWVSEGKGAYDVLEEMADFAFGPEDRAWYPREDDFFSHNERLYLKMKVDSIARQNSLASLPALFTVSGMHVLVTESGLQDYAGMWLKGDSATGRIRGVFPRYPVKTELLGDRFEVVRERAGYIARKNGPANLPWRILMIAEDEKSLLVNELVYQLAAPSAGDFSWVKPGKAIWDWWNDNNISGVDFRAGINTATYKYYIDFAAKYGLEYAVLDEGWSNTRQLERINPEVDMDELARYAAEKNVGLVLWVNWEAIARPEQLQAAMAQFSKWGVKAIKVDFMQRDDQVMVNYYEEVAKAAAAHRMLVDFHGAHKPAGLQRTYPNVITFEGVYGLEQSKGDRSKSIDPDHNVTFPFIRMAAGPADYTPGAMRNAQKEHWAPHWNKPMSIGTRCHQLAMYVIYESPLQMLADNPTHYYREPACMEFLAAVPAVWDTTIVQQAAIGSHILMVRKASDGSWYAGAMTNSKGRELTLDASFLPAGKYKMQVWQDGINADRNAEDFRTSVLEIDSSSQVPVILQPGGGWVARIVKI
ncbi:glycoside hydrolase family 97 protein [Chitinophaga pollutisoli]|uniref:Glycoside hydrolase family 97 protein n=1 Tax=Chitinophaga pollutisoli TaxID=3133966 RepID=A0ABZ2YQ14_9BACT